MPDITGKHLIGDTTSSASSTVFEAINPSTGEKLSPPFHEGSAAEADHAMKLADAAFDTLRARSAEDRAALVEGIADQIMALGDALLDRCHAETGLPMGRLTAERGRTVGQAKMFAQVLREGSYVDARIDPALPDRKPMARPDIRRMLMPIGPVVVFGASNFPLAISVAGTDTVCALGAGCPVVVKAHPGHPGTCELLGHAIAAALKQGGFPAGAFSLLQGASTTIGQALVKHPLARAVAFTGSLRGGRALFDAANSRPDPIPVYAELGSANPVFLLPGALASRGDEIAAGFVQSVALGVGQFCTNPGVVLGLRGQAMAKFTAKVAALAADVPPATMLHKGIRDAYDTGTETISKTNGVRLLGQSREGPDPARTHASTIVFHTDGNTWESQKHLHQEVFGPSSIIIEGDTVEQLTRIAENLEGHLTATLHGTPEDLKEYAPLVRILERKVGRIIFNGFPTGVEVCHAMHHGGPYPASLDPHWTSIGMASIGRFVRPVCYQSFPDSALPTELQNANPRGIMRLIDGNLTRGGM
ncbi:MAG: aldehyde dehydrogenase (NADP(+)) [Phycisphaeraceae bacterium]